jgi:hypothetical protein
VLADGRLASIYRLDPARHLPAPRGHDERCGIFFCNRHFEQEGPRGSEMAITNREERLTLTIRETLSIPLCA